MATLTSSLIVRLIDQVTGPARKIGSSLLGLNNVARGSFGANLTGAIERNNAALATARGKLFDAAAAFYVLKNAIVSPVKAAMEFESAMADVRKVVDFPTPQAFTDFQKQLIELSKTVPTSVNGLAQIAAAAGQAGIAGPDLIRFTEAAAKIGVAFDITADQAGDAMAKMMTGLGMSIDETVRLSDAMNHLSNAQASSAAELLDFVRRSGSMAKGFGLTAAQATAFGSAMISSGAQVDVASTSFQNMGAALVSGVAATLNQRKAFRRLGLDAKKVATAMQIDADGTILSVMEKIGELPADVRQATIFQLFGKNADAILPLVSNLDLLRESLALVDDETKYSGSSFREFGIRAATFENAVQTFNNRLTALKIAVGAALIPALNELMTALTPMIEGFTDWAAANPELLAQITQVVAGLIAFKAAAAALTFLGLIGKGGALALLALGFNTVGKAAIAAHGAIAGSLGLQAALAAGAGAKFGWMDKLAVSALALVRIVPGLNLVGPAIGAIAGAISWPVVAIITAIAAAGALIWKYWDRLSSIFAGVGRAIGEELAPYLEQIKPILEWFAPLGSAIATGWSAAADALGKAAGWIGSMFEQEILSDEQKAAFEQAGYNAATSMIEAIKSGFSGLVGWFSNLPAMLGAIDWSAAISGLLNAILEIPQRLKEIDWGGALASMNDALLGIPGRLIEGITGAFSGVDWGALFQGLVTAATEAALRLGQVDWGAAAAGLAASLVEGILSIPAKIVGIGESILNVFRNIKLSPLAQKTVDEFVAVILGIPGQIAGLPGMIVGAIDSIDLGSLIKWGEPPDWKSLLGVSSDGQFNITANLGMGVIDDFALWLRAQIGTGVSIAVNWLGGEVDGLISWLRGIAGTGLSLAVNVLSNPDEFITWLRDAIGTTATVTINAALGAVDAFLQWVHDVIGTVQNFSISINWPSPPAWLTWLMQNAANLLGLSGKTHGTLPPGGRPNNSATINGVADPALPAPTPRAKGGPVWPGGRFLVGEEQPEIFEPRTAGKITPLDEYRPPAASAPGGRSGGPISLSIGDIIIQAATNPEETANRVRTALRDELNGMLRAAHADVLART